MHELKAEAAMKTLVIGGTGMLGEPVVRALRSNGHDVRVMTRNVRMAARLASVAELVAGDVDDAAAVERAMSGCRWVHLSLDGHGDWDLERRGAKTVAKLAKKLGVTRLSMISGASTDERNAWFPMTRAKLDAEEALETSGVPYQVFRCTMFMETLPKLVRGAKATILGPQPSKLHFVAARDYAAMVARAFELPEAEDEVFQVRGPQAFTMEEALTIYCRKCAPYATVVHLPFGLARLVSLLPGNAELRHVALPLMHYFSQTEELGDPMFTNVLLGAPPTTLAAWAALQPVPVQHFDTPSAPQVRA